MYSNLFSTYESTYTVTKQLKINDTFNNNILKNSKGLSSKRVGKTVQQYARDILADSNATSLQKRANFARNSKRWSKK